MSALAIFSASFTMALVQVDGDGSLLFFDKSDADCLKQCVDQLKTKPDSVRLAFYRDLLSDRSLSGDDGLLVQLIEPSEVGDPVGLGELGDGGIERAL